MRARVKYEYGRESNMSMAQSNMIMAQSNSGIAKDKLVGQEIRSRSGRVTRSDMSMGASQMM